jgi:hypothetical protein
MVKYLGLTLVKELTWKAQLKNVMNKAYRAFWTCKGTFGKTVGSETQGVTLDLHHGNQTCSDLWLHSTVTNGQLQCQQDGA